MQQRSLSATVILVNCCHCDFFQTIFVFFLPNYYRLIVSGNLSLIQSERIRFIYIFLSDFQCFSVKFQKCSCQEIFWRIFITCWGTDFMAAITSLITDTTVRTTTTMASVKITKTTTKYIRVILKTQHLLYCNKLRRVFVIRLA